MKRIITAVSILIILSSSVLAKNIKEVNILSDRLGNVWLELTKLGMEFSQLELYRDSITNQTLAAEVMQNSLAIYVLFCDYEREILIIYPYIKKEEKANLARYIYKRIERKKGDLDYAKRLFLQAYSELVKKSAFHVADKIKKQIEEIDILYIEALNFYESQR